MVPITSNQNQAGCTPVSSNCVVWQGPDIPCIQLCKGDSISDVTAKLAQQLCDLLAQVNILNFAEELLCFQPLCPNPTNLEELIKFILQKLCALEECCGGSTPGPEGCPDCVVTVAPCFYTTTPLGDLVTTMQLTDYARAIGVKVCDILDQLLIINQTLIDYGNRITNLENAVDPLPPTPPFVPASCLSPTSLSQLDAIVLLNTNFCSLVEATGSPSDIFSAIAVPCANLNASPSLANPSTTMGTIPGWNLTVLNLADSINNMWLTICDLRAAAANLANCCSSGCNDLVVNMIATYSAGVVTITFSGTVPAGFVDCAPGGNQLKITDINGNTQIATIPVLTSITTATNQTVTLNGYMNTSSDLTLELFGCWTRTSPATTCERQLLYVIVNSANCPVPTLVPTDTTIGYSFNNTISPFVTYHVRLSDSFGVQIGVDDVIVNPAIGVVSGTFTGLTASTGYRISIQVSVGAVYNPSTPFCPFIPISTVVEALWLWQGTDPTGDFFLQDDGTFWKL